MTKGSSVLVYPGGLLPSSSSYQNQRVEGFKKAPCGILSAASTRCVTCILDAPLQLINPSLGFVLLDRWALPGLINLRIIWTSNDSFLTHGFLSQRTNQGIYPLCPSTLGQTPCATFGSQMEASRSTDREASLRHVPDVPAFCPTRIFAEKASV